MKEGDLGRSAGEFLPAAERTSCPCVLVPGEAPGHAAVRRGAPREAAEPRQARGPVPLAAEDRTPAGRRVLAERVPRGTRAAEDRTPAGRRDRVERGPRDIRAAEPDDTRAPAGRTPDPASSSCAREARLRRRDSFDWGRNPRSRDEPGGRRSASARSPHGGRARRCAAPASTPGRSTACPNGPAARPRERHLFHGTRPNAARCGNASPHPRERRAPPDPSRRAPETPCLSLREPPELARAVRGFARPEKPAHDRCRQAKRRAPRAPRVARHPRRRVRPAGRGRPRPRAARRPEALSSRVSSDAPESGRAATSHRPRRPVRSRAAPPSRSSVWPDAPRRAGH